MWVSDRPLDPNEEVFGDYVMTLDVPESAIKKFEWPEEEKAYREFIVPAEVLNRFGLPTLFEEDDSVQELPPDPQR